MPDQTAMTVDAQQEILRRLKEIDAAAARAEAEYGQLHEALRELYEASHDYLNVLDARGRMREGTPRLNGALAAARRALTGAWAPPPGR